MADITKIKIKIEVSKKELKLFKPETASINIEGSNIKVIDSPNPANDAKGTF
ncbi:MAG: hypothetical protein ACK5MQ_02255 [Pikeienuella sp.]